MADQLQWESLSDFTAGIQHKTSEQGGASSPARLGAATSEKTYRCIALPGGGLGPLPRQADTITKAGLEADITRVHGQKYHISGFHTTGPILPVTGDASNYGEFHFAWEYVYDSDNNGSFDQRRWKWQRYRGFEASPNFEGVESVDSTGNAVTDYRGTFFIDHRAHDNDPFEVGTPVVVAAWYADGGGAEEIIAMFPDPVDPGTSGTRDISTTIAADKIVSHQGRVVIFEQVGHLHGLNGSWSSDEQIYWTKVNLPTLQETTASVFSQGQMTGYGAVASVSAQQLLCIKAKGGGYLVEGDLDDPTIVALPGIISTGTARVIPVYTPVGLVYGVQAGGVYAWQGGDNSKLLSPQLDDDFWQTDAVLNNDFINYNGRFDVSRDWVLCPNNFIYDCTMDSWWRIEDRAIVEILHWCVANNGAYIWGAPATYVDSSTPIAYMFNRQLGALSFSWQSQPLPFSMDRYITVREVIVITQGVGTVTITLENQDTTTQSKTFTTTQADHPEAQRTNFALDGSHIQVRIESDGDDAVAPIVYEVRVGYQEIARIEAV